MKSLESSNSYRQQNGGCQGLQGGRMGNYCLIGTVSFWENEKVLEMDDGIG